MLESLILKWGYLILFAGSLLEGETVLLASGTLAHKGLLNLPLVIAVATLGGFTGDVFWYFIGRKLGMPFLEKSPKLQGHLEAVKRYSDRYGGFFVFLMRFIYGIRTAAPVFLGATRFPILKYLAFNALGSLVWAAAIGILGYQLGMGAKEILDRHPHIEEVLVAAILVVVVFIVIRHGYKFWKTRQEK